MQILLQSIDFMPYTVGKVRFLLRNYQTLAQGARLPSKGDTLGTRTPPRDEAPTAFRSTEKADIETAMRTLSFERQQIVFMVVCQGESSLRNGKRYDWRRRIIEWWGFDNDKEHFSGGDLTKIVDESIQSMADYLNGGTAKFAYGENDAVTVEEVVPPGHAKQFAALSDAEAREFEQRGSLFPV